MSDANPVSIHRRGDLPYDRHYHQVEIYSEGRKTGGT